MTKRQKEFKQLWLKIGEESGQLEEMRRQTEQRTEQRVARQKALETARNALAEGLEPATIQRITGLSRETIEGITTCGAM